MKIKIFFLLLVGILILTTCNVNAKIRPGSLFLSPNIGFYQFEGSQNIENTITYGIGLGFDLTEHFGIEGIYNWANTETESGGADVDLSLYRLEGFYYLNDWKGFVPYLAAGFGTLNLDHPGNKDGESIADYGLGIKKLVSDNLAFRADVRHILPMPGNNLLFNIGISFMFGGQKKSEVVQETTRPEPVPPADSDGDGVTDEQDKCPNTPAGVKVDSNGCPQPIDSDGDGVNDEQDKCPNTPESATVDQRGCWVLKDVNFDANMVEIRASDTNTLDDVVNIMEKNTSLKIEIDGHTDNLGSAKYNEDLSQKRAQSVMDYMVKKGIAQDRLTAKGFGFSQPRASNDTPEGRAENRRVELTPIQ